MFKSAVGILNYKIDVHNKRIEAYELGSKAMIIKMINLNINLNGLFIYTMQKYK